jgi:hypothetical protein
MRMLKTYIVLGICIVGLGLYGGWFFPESQGRDDEGNKLDITLTVDPDKVKDDVGRTKSKTTKLGNQAADKKSSNTDEADNIERIDESHTRSRIRV